MTKPVSKTTKKPAAKKVATKKRTSKKAPPIVISPGHGKKAASRVRGGGAQQWNTPELRRAAVERIHDAMASGLSLKVACEMDGSVPDRSTFYSWLRDEEKLPEADRELTHIYQHARSLLVEYYLDETIEIADDKSDDAMEVPRKGKSFERILNREFVDRSKLRILARQWYIEKVMPRKYGPLLRSELAGADGKDLFASLNDSFRKAGEEDPGE